MDVPSWATIEELAQGIRDKRWSAVDLTSNALDRIAKHDPRLSAFVGRPREKEAEAAYVRIAADPDAPVLCGIPYAAKDIIDVAREITACGCPVLEDNRAISDAAVIERLSAVGMVLVGKTRTSPLACEITGLNHSETPARNPWMEEPHVTGGSSSGSAAAVAAGLVPMALGSDTGGSVRVPAALCGIVGYRTTLGQVSRAGVMPLAGSFDTVGPLTRTIGDAAHVFGALRGFDPRDPSTRQAGRGDTSEALDGVRFATAEGLLFEDVDQEVEASVRAFADSLKGFDATVDRIDCPIFAEMAADSRLDGLMDGEAWRATSRSLTSWGDSRDPLTNWIIAGADVSDAFIDAGRTARTEYETRFVQDMAEVDILIVPTTRRTARPIDDVEANYGTHSSLYVRNASCGS